jgi:hypothetical protein
MSENTYPVLLCLEGSCSERKNADSTQKERDRESAVGDSRTPHTVCPAFLNLVALGNRTSFYCKCEYENHWLAGPPACEPRDEIARRRPRDRAEERRHVAAVEPVVDDIAADPDVVARSHPELMTITWVSD